MLYAKRRTELLVALTEADGATADVFFTASSFDGTTLFHDGLPGGQVDVPIGDIKALAARGDLAITEHRDYGDIAFVITDQGRAEAERVTHGGLTEVEAQRARADLAETAVRELHETIEGEAHRVGERRERIASRIAWVPAVAVAIALGVALFWLSESGPLRLVAGILLALGVAGSWAFRPARGWIAGKLIRLLRVIHDST